MAQVTTLAELQTFLQSFEDHNSVQKVVFGNEDALTNEIEQNGVADGQFVIFAEYPNAPIENNSESHFINFDFGFNILTPSDGTGIESYAGELSKMDAALALVKDFSAWVMYQRRVGAYPQVQLLANEMSGLEPVQFWGAANAIGYRAQVSIRHKTYFDYDASNYS